jgi:hypothetical protein
MLLILFLHSPGSIQGQGDAARYLEALEKKYSGLRDYIVDANIHFDIETFKAPDLQAKIYYKVPDKIKVESKRVLFFPREGGYFNPSLFRKEDFTILLLEHATQGKQKAVKLRLIPRQTRGNIRDMVLTIDIERNLVREVNMEQTGGREVRAGIAYGTFGSMELPTRINLLLDFPAIEPEGVKGFSPSAPGNQRVTGRIEMTYSNYRVNSGLTDEIFREIEPRKP